MRGFVQDVRYATRLLVKSPAYTLAAALSLALGVGANTTIFTVLNSVLLHPLAVREPSALVSVFTTDARNTGRLAAFLPTSWPNFQDYRDHSQSFEGLFVEQFVPLSVAHGGQAEQVFGEIVSGNFFSVLGVTPRLGRAFRAEEDGVSGAHPVVVLGDGFWKRELGADPGVVGRTITLNRQPFTVIGVAPEGFKGTNAIGAPAMWVPLAMHREVLSGFAAENFDSRRALLFNITGRLKSGIPLAQAEAEMKTLASQLEREYPVPNKGRSVVLVPLSQATINPGFRSQAVLGGAMLMAVVAFVLLIACANVANLLLARATTRRKEIAVRLSLGAGRGRLVRQLLTESLLLAGCGGLLGLIVATWGRNLLWAYRPPFLPADAVDLSFDGRVLAFTVGITLATGILFGLVPALQASRSDLVMELKDRSSLPTGGGRRFSARNIFMVGQLALSLVALIAAGLFLRSLGNAQRIDPGFEVQRVGVLRFDLGSQGYAEPAGRDFQRRVLDRVRTLPGVQSAALSDSVPLFGGGLARSVFPEGRDASDPKNGILVQLNAVTVGYFSTLGIPRLRGRDFTDADNEAAPRVAIINETAAKRFWPGEDAVGKRFTFFDAPAPTEVVGIARDSKYNFIGEDPMPFIYTPLLQAYNPAVALNVRGAEPGALLPAARSAVQQFDRQLPLVNVSTLTEVFDQSLWAPRMGATLLALFALLALVLAAVGIYGVTSYAVEQRTREIGVRMALGAADAEVLTLVLRQSMTLVALGIAAGLVVALALARTITSLLYDVAAVDPVTYVAIPIILAVVAFAACYVPARRASRVDPLLALRAE
jgi:macrolide transport system ATP-binding/permease protein